MALEILRRDAAEAEINISYGFQMVGVIGSSASGNEEKIFEQILEFIQKQENMDGYGIHLVNTNQRVMVIFGDQRINCIKPMIRFFGLGECIATSLWWQSAGRIVPYSMVHWPIWKQTQL